MPIVSVYQCPRTEKLFMLDEKRKYLKHLKSLAGKNRKEKLREKLRAQFEITLRDNLNKISSFTMLSDFLNTNATTIAIIYSTSSASSYYNCIRFTKVRYSACIKRCDSRAVRWHDISSTIKKSGFYGTTERIPEEWYKTFLAEHCGIYFNMSNSWWNHGNEFELDLSMYPQLKAVVDQQIIDDVPDKLVRKLQGKRIGFKYKEPLSNNV